MLELSRKVAARIAGVPRERFDQDDLVWKTSVEEIPRLVAALEPLARG